MEGHGSDDNGTELKGRDGIGADGTTHEHPAWRAALTAFFDAGFVANDVLTFDWLYAQFQIARPQPTTILAEAQKAELEFLQQFKSFSEALLHEHQVALDNVRGQGYRVVPAAEQSRWAQAEAGHDLRRALKHWLARTVNVDHAQLTADQRKENADAIARAAMLRGMVKRALNGRASSLPKNG